MLFRKQTPGFFYPVAVNPGIKVQVKMVVDEFGKVRTIGVNMLTDFVEGDIGG